MPEISIVTPCLNSADFVLDSVRSVASQTVRAEHIVVDGLSTDDSVARIQSSGAAVRVLSRPPEGIFPAINAGIRETRGAVVGVLHADDFYPGANVLAQVAEVFEDPAVDACYGDLCYVDRADPSRIVRYWRAGSFDAGRFRHGWMPPHPTFFVRRARYDALGLYRSDLGTAADYELMMRFLVKNQCRAVYIPQVLVHMRAGGSSNASLRARIRANRMDRQAWRVNGLRPYPWTLLAKPLRKVGQWLSRP